MMVNSLGRELPEKVGSYIVRPYGSEAVETDLAWGPNLSAAARSK